MRVRHDQSAAPTRCAARRGLWSLDLLIAAWFLCGPLFAQPLGQSTPQMSEAQLEKLAERNRLWDEAAALHLEAIDTEHPENDPDPKKVAKAIELTTKMIPLEMALLGRNHREVASSYEWLAGLHDELKQFQLADAARARQIEMLTAIYGPDDWRVREARLNRRTSIRVSRLSKADTKRLHAAAESYMEVYFAMPSSDNDDEQVRRVEHAAKTIRELMGDDDEFMYAECLVILVEIDIARGRYAAAESRADDVIDLAKKVYGEDCPIFAQLQNWLGQVHLELGDYVRAEECFRKALDLGQKYVREEYPEIATGLEIGPPIRRPDVSPPTDVEASEAPSEAAVSGSWFNLLEGSTEAEPEAQSRDQRYRLLKQEDQSVAFDLGIVAKSLSKLAELYGMLGDTARSGKMYRQALAVCWHIATAGMDPSAAREEHPLPTTTFGQAMALSSELGSSDEMLLEILNELANLHLSVGEPDRAEQLLWEAVRRHEGIGDWFSFRLFGPEPENDPVLAKLLNNLSALFLETDGHLHGPSFSLIESDQPAATAPPEAAPDFSTLVPAIDDARDVAGGHTEFDEVPSPPPQTEEVHPDPPAYDEVPPPPEASDEIPPAPPEIGEDPPPPAVYDEAPRPPLEFAEAPPPPTEFAEAPLPPEQDSADSRDFIGNSDDDIRPYPVADDTTDSGPKVITPANPLLLPLTLFRAIVSSGNRDAVDRSDEAAKVHSDERAGQVAQDDSEREAPNLVVGIGGRRLDLTAAADPNHREPAPTVESDTPADLEGTVEHYVQDVPVDDAEFAAAPLTEPAPGTTSIDVPSNDSFELTDEEVAANEEEERRTTERRSKLKLLADAKGDYARALPFFEMARDISENAFGTKHPDYAMSIENLALLNLKMGQPDDALSLCRHAGAIYKSVLGDKHPDYASNLNLQAWMLELQGDFSQAEPLNRQALEIMTAQLDATSVILTERQQLELGQDLRPFLDCYLHCLLHVGGRDETAYRAVLACKGATLLRQRAARIAADEPDLAPLFAELQAITCRWATLAQATMPPEKADRWRKQMDALTADKERLEAELSRRSSRYRDATKKVTLEQLQASLPADAAVVDYSEFLFSAPIKNEPDKFEERQSLLAFVVRRGQQVTMFDLGEVAQVSAAIDLWRSSCGAADDAQQASRRLRELLWEPLLPAIGKASIILISPDGALGRLPFAALPGKKANTYLIEDHRLALVPVPQLIPMLVDAMERKRLPRDLLLVGGVDYDHRTTAEADRPATDEPPPLLPFERRDANAMAALRSRFATKPWGFLSGSDSEVVVINDVFEKAMKRKPNTEKVVVLRGAAATEEKFRKLAPQCYMLHISTHGFFAAPEKEGPTAPEKELPAAPEQEIAVPNEPAPPPPEEPSASMPAAAGIALLAMAAPPPPLEQGTRGGLSEERLEAVRGYSPGLLSGLVLAGANNPPEIPDDPAQLQNVPDDGYLTADEIAFLPLGGAQLVVLSACETGLGEVAGGEGLLGIQRAFQVAGARTTIATLWKVNDEATRRIMEQFYRNYLDERMSPLDALREAQLWALNNPDLVPRGADAPPDSSATGRLPPKYWAAFTLSGDWR